MNIVAMGLIQLVPGQRGAAPAQPRGAAVKIVNAQWGRDQTWADVTARVQELVDAGGEFVLNVKTLKSDPTPTKVKRLKIVYRKNGNEKTLWFDEKAKVDPGKLE